MEERGRAAAMGSAGREGDVLFRSLIENCLAG